MTNGIECLMLDPEESCIERLASTSLALLDMLKRLEWSGIAEYDDNYKPIYECPICNELQSTGHAEDCDLGNLLKEIGG
jgi:hypothetical protein